jgi:hypothetical protein
MTGMLDLGAEIATNNGGDLRGGEINFLGHSFRTVRYPNGLRYVFFALDDNFDDSHTSTLLAVGTHQRMRDLKPIFSFPRPVGNENALISVAVERIGKPDDLMRDEKGGDLFFRPVFGVLTLRATDGDDVEERLKEHARRAKWIDAPTNAWAFYSYDANGKVVHVHFICRNDDDSHTTAAEKARRIAALMAQPTDPAVINARDGNQRLFSLTRLP